MRRILLAIFLCVLVSFTGYAGPPSENNEGTDSFPYTEFLLLNLQKDQTLRVEVGSWGCFHRSTSRMHINGDIVKVEYGSKYLPDYKLTDKELVAIDKHLYFIAANRDDGSCTTAHNVKLSIVESGEVVKSNEFSYTGCMDSFGWNNDGLDVRVMGYAELSYKIHDLNDVRPGSRF